VWSCELAKAYIKLLPELFYSYLKSCWKGHTDPDPVCQIKWNTFILPIIDWLYLIAHILPDKDRRVETLHNQL
jgi:hypothetical protein